MATPAIQRRRLGKALKEARERSGKTQDEAAEVIDNAASKISRLELGQSGIRLVDLNLLLDLYGASEAEAESMRELARSGKERGRWRGYRNVVPSWAKKYIDLEADASEIRWYQAETVPGLLQIESYIRAINATAQPPINDEEWEKQVQVSLERAAILDRSDAPQLGFILSESALRRNVGGKDVMWEQLGHLVEVSDRPNVELQVLPFDAQTFVPACFSFILLRFDDNAATDTVYLEDWTDASYEDRLDAVRAYSRLWNRLQAAALGQVESRHLILRLADQMET